MNLPTLITRILAQHTRSTNSDYRGGARLVPSIDLLQMDLRNGIADWVREKHDHTVSRTVSDLQARNDRQYTKIQNLEEDKAILLSDKNQLQAVNNSLRATVDRLKRWENSTSNPLKDIRETKTMMERNMLRENLKAAEREVKMLKADTTKLNIVAKTLKEKEALIDSLRAILNR